MKSPISNYLASIGKKGGINRWKGVSAKNRSAAMKKVRNATLNRAIKQRREEQEN